MKVNQYLMLAALSLLAMSNSCKKEEEITPCTAATEVETAQITSLKPTITEPVPYVGQTNEYIINSAAEYQEVFAGILPPVDFTNYTLLAGKTRLPSRGHVLAQQVVQTCLGYTYTVQLEADAQPVAANVVYYVLVPKIGPGTKVVFDIKLPPLAAKS
ncbi:hypothetical protein GO988_09260 [Hymenobacter sp. HMF4947]|uniref:Protease complex subunit PrcB family protein n=1 Tax=Hymenobacter ginkgonis TaxID=2682976 RepID=A0A7K1TDN4_9BACT|nr:hypothetical protein [Hymenobacter ginkgonis]MVN76510.1 hypothetical protein [Hymenobacter ginkgonis]